MLDPSKRRTAAGIVRNNAELLKRGYKIRADGDVIYAARAGDASARTMEIRALHELADALEAEPPTDGRTEDLTAEQWHRLASERLAVINGLSEQVAALKNALSERDEALRRPVMTSARRTEAADALREYADTINREEDSGPAEDVDAADNLRALATELEANA